MSQFKSFLIFVCILMDWGRIDRHTKSCQPSSELSNAFLWAKQNAIVIPTKNKHSWTRPLKWMDGYFLNQRKKEDNLTLLEHFMCEFREQNTPKTTTRLTSKLGRPQCSYVPIMRLLFFVLFFHSSSIVLRKF